MAWNKGKTSPESVRSKVSKTMKQKWEDPEFRASVTEAMKGKIPWNKGRTMSPETREKMRQAKLNSQISRSTRKKMSAARQGRPISAATAAIVSAKLTGRPKTEEHRQNIAAGQRRRHAAIRVLKAVESVYETSAKNESKVSAQLGAMARAEGAASSARRKAKSQVLNAFKAELREYRSLQEELSPWTTAFMERHSRKPTMLDVQMTGIEWLISRYKQYIVLRDRLFNESSLLRTKLSVSVPDVVGADGGSIPAGTGPTNANGPTTLARSAMASRVAAAMQYKLAREQAQQATSAASEAHVKPALVGGEEPQAAGGMLPAEAEEKSHNLIVAAKGQSTAPRVRAAMQAAMEYRMKKAQATKAAADAAAAAAKAGWHDVQLSVAKATPSPPAELDSIGSSNAAAEHEAQPVEGLTPAPALPLATAPLSGSLGQMLPADVARAQVAAHRALQEVRNAEAEVRRALRLNLVSDSEEEDGNGSGSPTEGPVTVAAGAGA